MNKTTHLDLAHRTDEAQARFAARVTHALSQHLAVEPRPDIDERLRVAREQAVARARAARHVVSGPAAVSAGGTLTLGGNGGDSQTPWWLRLSSLLPLVVLLAGLLLIDSRYAESQVEAAAEVDAAILTDDLPPEAYRDPGFTEFLKTARP